MPRVRTKEVRGPRAGHPSHGTSVCVFWETEKRQTRLRSVGKATEELTRARGIKATAVPLSSESRSSLHCQETKPTHQVQPLL